MHAAVIDQPTGNDAALRAYRANGGYVAWTRLRRGLGVDGVDASEGVLAAIEVAGLTGKGGAGFPAHRKLRLLREQAGEHKVLVVNGSEHEPGSSKDRHVLEFYPHKVIEGALLVAYAAGARQIVFAVNADSIAAVASLRRAIAEVESDPDLDLGSATLALHPVPGAYIVGEETALLATLEGTEPLPRRKPPYPIQSGLRQRPTLIQNVETVAHVPFIVAHGGAAWRALGASGQGTTLCTLGDEYRRPGVYEIPIGTPLRRIVDDWGGGLRNGSAVRAVQPGGPSAGFLAASDLDLPLDAQVLAAHGSALGCAVIRAYSVNECMVRRIGEILHFFALGSCGQCPRCRMETNMLDTIVRQVIAGHGTRALLDKIDGLIALAAGQGICTLIDMPVAPIRTGLRLFADEFTAHLEHRCPHCVVERREPLLA